MMQLCSSGAGGSSFKVACSQGWQVGAGSWLGGSVLSCGASPQGCLSFPRPGCRVHKHVFQEPGSASCQSQPPGLETCPGCLHCTLSVSQIVTARQIHGVGPGLLLLAGGGSEKVWLFLMCHFFLYLHCSQAQ